MIARARLAELGARALTSANWEGPRASTVASVSLATSSSSPRTEEGLLAAGLCAEPCAPRLRMSRWKEAAPSLRWSWRHGRGKRQISMHSWAHRSLNPSTKPPTPALLATRRTVAPALRARPSSSSAQAQVSSRGSWTRAANANLFVATMGSSLRCPTVGSGSGGARAFTSTETRSHSIAARATPWEVKWALRPRSQFLAR
mmetsp:Transcript_68987/g.147614  ORF Transcript_68987/g.147614 Transcript_68987/m.147614 type:complete len:201 (-) Transcript_68987:1355-1957(-)